MKLKDYIKVHKVNLIGDLISLMLINLILVGSSSLKQGKVDILYLNLLLLVVGGALRLYDFFKSYKRYKAITDTLRENKELVYESLDEQDFHIGLLKQALLIKDRRHKDQLQNYEQNRDELQDYMTKWVHEMKVSVAVCDLMLQEREQEGQMKAFALQIEKIKFMINQVLHVARANNYSEDIQAQEINLEQEVKNAIKHNASFFLSKNIAIDMEVLPARIISDKKWIQYILSQMLNNSSKYTLDGGELRIYTKEDERGVYLHIRDTGIGIAKEEQKRIFEKGFTGSNGRNTTKSTGMGLYYAKKMADCLSIGIEVKSEVNQYTEFVLSFYKLREYFKVTKM